MIRAIRVIRAPVALSAMIRAIRVIRAPVALSA
jgi:hypothetical protein